MANATDEGGRRKPQKTVGEIGTTRITQTEVGPIAEILRSDLPTDKEALEKFFAEKFVEAFNSSHPLGRDVEVAIVKQNDTSDLDFVIKCSVATYLELAELTPLSQGFGRKALKTGKLNVYGYAKWISSLIGKKEKSYGGQSSGIILLLFATHWQFFVSEKVVECLRSLCRKNGCNFAAVFVFLTNGTDLLVPTLIHPYPTWGLRTPREYAGFTLHNRPPGQTSWKIDDSES